MSLTVSDTRPEYYRKTEEVLAQTRKAAKAAETILDSLNKVG